MAEDAGVNEGKNTGDETRFLGETANWIDAYGRKHFPSVHTHLGVDSPDGRQNTEREILPWLKFSAQLDPTKVDTYTVAAYWLRRTGKPMEAERFLREGLEANPQSVEILFDRNPQAHRGRQRRAWFDAGPAAGGARDSTRKPITAALVSTAGCDRIPVAGPVEPDFRGETAKLDCGVLSSR